MAVPKGLKVIAQSLVSRFVVVFYSFNKKRLCYNNAVNFYMDTGYFKFSLPLLFFMNPLVNAV
jgi:hypothetical protein